MKKLLSCLVVFYASNLLSQPVELDWLGQTPGGSSFHVNYDANSQRLFVGCGVSVWQFDASQPDSIQLQIKRPLKSLVNETMIWGNSLLAAATNDGLWAMDLTSNDLALIHHFPTPGDSAAYDLDRVGDSLLLANGKEIVVLDYSEQNGFQEIDRFGNGEVVCLAAQNDLVAIGSRALINGTIEIYHVSDFTMPIASWTHGGIVNIEDLQFADQSDSILYVCGGTNLIGTNSRFFALRLGENGLNEIDQETFAGALSVAIPNIINMDSRNDTLYLASMASTLGLETNLPVLDGNDLASHDSLNHIADLYPGFWHFDVSILGDLPYISIASEWFGVLINDISTLSRYDTVRFTDTGGWGKRGYVRGDTLWACLEGYGLSAYIFSDLKDSSNFTAHEEIFHVNSSFTHDMTFVDDTLIVAAGKSNKYYFYSIKDWLLGGEPELLANINKTGLFALFSLGTLETNVGKRIVGGLVNDLTGGGGRLDLIDPYTYPDYDVISSETIGVHPGEIITIGDSIWVGAKIGSQDIIAHYRVENDQFSLVASANAPGPVETLAKDGRSLAAVCGEDGVVLYEENAQMILEKSSIQTGQLFMDADIRGDYLYVAIKFEGLAVYDISDITQPQLVATGRSSGSWFERPQFGVNTVTLAPDGTILLGDFHAGVIMIEAWDPVNVSIDAHIQPDLLVELHPNPSDGHILVKWNRPISGKVKLRLMDLQGRLIQQQLLNGTETELYFKELARGLYVTQIQSGEGIFQQKLVIE